MRRICVALTIACYTINSLKAAETPTFPTYEPPIVWTAGAIPDNSSDYYSVRLTVTQIRLRLLGERRPRVN